MRKIKSHIYLGVILRSKFSRALLYLNLLALSGVSKEHIRVKISSL